MIKFVVYNNKTSTMKRYLTLLLMCAMAFVACKEQEETKVPVFTVTSETAMTFDAAGGNGTITYTIENPSDALSVNAECDAEWIVGITEGTSVTFTVTANESTEARSTEITVSYGESGQKVSITQSGKEPEPVFTLTSEATMTYTCEGGAGTITYTLENPKAGVNVTATCAQEWITDITVGDQITFNVAANEATEAREATIAVAYGDLGFNVTVAQEGDPTITFTAAVLAAEYYGTAYSDYNNYFVSLSDIGFDEDGYALPNATYFQVDLYSTVEAGSGDLRIPDGVYTFDANDTFEAGTFSAEYSKLVITDEMGDGDIIYFVGGTMTVTSEGIVLVVECENGQKYRAVYEGEPVVEGEPPLSNLEDDYSVNSDNGFFYAESWGDYFGIGKQDYLVSIYEDGETFSGDCFMLEILNDNPAGITGTYKPIPYDAAMSGNVVEDCYLIGLYEDYDGDLFPIGSWLLSILSNEITFERAAPLEMGDMVITQEDGIYTFTFNGFDDAGNKITASVKGTAVILDEDGEEIANPNATVDKFNSINKKAMKMSPKAEGMISMEKNAINF